MSVSRDHYVKNNLDVEGVITISSSIDMLNAGTLQLGQTTATKLELSKTAIVTEMKGPATALEGLTVTGATTISTTLAVGQADAPVASAILELESTTKGLLFPRMTTTQRNAIGTPAAGLVVYDTTEGAIYHRNGTDWVMQVKNILDTSNLIVGDGTSGNSIASGAVYNVIVGRGAGADMTTAVCNTFIGDAADEQLHTHLIEKTRPSQMLTLLKFPS